MCLAVPGKIESIESGLRATVDMLGVKREASLRLVPMAQVGDYILVHAGFGIQVIDPEEAAETIELFRQMPDLAEDELGGEEPFGSAASAGTDPAAALAGAL